MFESKIQKAWDERFKDFGLGRMALFLSLFNVLLFFVGAFLYGKFNLYILLPIVFSMSFYMYRNQIIAKGHVFILFMLALLMNVAITYNYYMVGVLDRMAGMLIRHDALMLKFDLFVFGKPPALIIESFLTGAPIMAKIFYDAIMVAYMLYYALPYVGGILYYLQLPRHLKYRIGRFCSSIVLYYSINYVLYFTVPVTGPQYYIRESFQTELPLSFFGKWMFGIIKGGQLNFIDCFPSGHVGATFLVTFWLFKINHGARFIAAIILTGVVFATIALRYHYVADALAAIPLAILVYYLSNLLYPAPVDIKSLRGDA